LTEISKNSIHRVTIEGWSAEGMGVARLGGLVLFVRGAARGDVCDVRILKTGGSAAWAKVEKLIRPASCRAENDCPVFEKCGGCDFRHVSYREELEAKKQRVDDALRRIGGISVSAEEIIGAENICGYRNKAVYPVGRQDGKPVTGFYRKRSHEIMPVERCLIQHEAADIAAGTVRDWMERCGVPEYDEETGRGLVRRVYTRVGSRGETLVCLIASDGRLPHTEELVLMLREALPEMAGLVLNVNPSRGNAVLGDRYIPLWGKSYLEDSLCGLKFRLSPASFYQINREQAEKLYDKAVEYAGLDGTQTVLDLYCGTGTISLCMAKKARRVIGVEIVEQAIVDAKENARRNGIENAEFFCGDAGEAARELSARGIAPDVVVVDPPRKGLEAEVVETIMRMCPYKVVYVSCDPATLARDLKLFAQGGMQTQKVTAVDMFPRTRHVETVVLMSRVKE